jgi:hypothetical protein
VKDPRVYLAQMLEYHLPPLKGAIKVIVPSLEALERELAGEADEGQDG